jgi:hypothetical protein
MLGDLSILEYLNGEEPWYAVNPVVRKLEKFKRAAEAIGRNETNERGLITDKK